MYTSESYICGMCKEQPNLLPDGTLLPCPGYVDSDLQKVADAMDILLKAQQEGEAEFMDGEQFPGLKVLIIKDEDRDSE